MSGGFFRGTSADQDTRFSNKQAKLLKSQKFAPELEHLVDMTKIKMDVMRPWIAHRVTEFLGFEDEVLINFIYGLLDLKEVNGKEIQISLTGFMEKNTGKFMKELWTLLLSAQKNASGVPQQFLDAKEEETRKKKAETDRIMDEIQRKKEEEGQELELEKMKKMDGKVDISRVNNSALERSLRHQPRTSNRRSADEETNGRNSSRGRSRISRSPHSAERSLSLPRATPSRSLSKSFSNSRSHSDERHRSRSISGPPQPKGRSISSEKVLGSPPRHSVTPRRRDSPQQSLSPSRRRPAHFRRRSISRSRRRSPSPVRHRLRSPMRRRSRSPMRRRSRSPIQRRSRSPMRRRSRSPMRYRSRSPVRRRSRSPLRRRSQSPMRRRSPSPGRRRSPSSMRRRYRRSPSTPWDRSTSPIRRRPTIPARRRSPTPSRRRPPSPQGWGSKSPIRRTPPSPVTRRSPMRRRRSPILSPRDRIRVLEKHSPVRRAPSVENVECSVANRKVSDSVKRWPPVSVMSPQRDPRDRNDSRKKWPALSPSPYKSPSDSESPPATRKRSSSEDRSPVKQTREQRTRDGIPSPQKPNVKQTREWMTHGGSPSPPRKPGEDKSIHYSPEARVPEEETNYAREDEDREFTSSGKRYKLSSTTDSRIDSVEKVRYKGEYSLERLAHHHSGETRGRPDNIELRKKNRETKSETISRKVLYSQVSEQDLPSTYKGTLSSKRVRESHFGEGYKDDEKIHSRPNDVRGSDQHHGSGIVSKLSKKVEHNNRSGSSSEESDKHRTEVNEKRRQKKSKRHEVASDDDSSHDSQIEERKEAKRRRKEEKKLKKEERRRRREERRRRREERRAEKLKLMSVGTVTLHSDLEKNHDGYASDGERTARRESRTSDIEEADSKQKKLEIALREKALESLRAKKAVVN